MSNELDALEAKIQKAVDRIQQLRKRNAELKAKLDGVDLSKMSQLEKERSQWQDERRVLTRRVEEILAKLEYLESEAVQH